MAERLQVANLVLWHTEDTHLPHRIRDYLAEGRQWFSGGLYVPDDLEVIELVPASRPRPALPEEHPTGHCPDTR